MVRRKRPDFLDRADADAVGFAQSAIDGPGFRHTHLSTVDQRRDIGRISIAVANEPATTSGFVNSSSEGVATGHLIGKVTNWLDLHSGAAATLGKADQTSVGHVPTTAHKKEVTAL